MMPDSGWLIGSSGILEMFPKRTVGIFRNFPPWPMNLPTIKTYRNIVSVWM